MPYLHCSRCRLTVYSAAGNYTGFTCPRCAAALDAEPRSMFSSQAEDGAYGAARPRDRAVRPRDPHRLIRKALSDTGVFRDGGKHATIPKRPTA